MEAQFIPRIIKKYNLPSVIYYRRVNMICPHCNVAASLEFEDFFAEKAEDYEQTKEGYSLAWEFCPECGKPIVLMKRGTCLVRSNEYGVGVTDILDGEARILYPTSNVRTVAPEVPEPHSSDFLEACSVLALSPKASAALSRRTLQNILREQFSIQHSSLAQEIEAFIGRDDIPSYLSEAVDAIRNIGNFAAHPLKDTHSDQIVDVESGEAEWLIEVLESLFDFTFVQPKKLQERKEKLNDKLRKLGKPEMKS
jgi:hypothetical protein